MQTTVVYVTEDRICWKTANSIRHRINGPAEIYQAGMYHYRQKGKLHRLDGPAFGTTRHESNAFLWYYEGELLNQERHTTRVASLAERS